MEIIPFNKNQCKHHSAPADLMALSQESENKELDQIITD
jgi:hypothetical protein